MANPLNEKQSNAQEPIYPEIKRGIMIAVSNFDDVWKLSKVFKDKYI